MKVAKHGNRAASSLCGTADCLEAVSYTHLDVYKRQLKLRTLGLTEEEAEEVIIQNFLN